MGLYPPESEPLAAVGRGPIAVGRDSFPPALDLVSRTGDLLADRDCVPCPACWLSDEPPASGRSEWLRLLMNPEARGVHLLVHGDL